MEWWQTSYDEGFSEIMFGPGAWERAAAQCDALIDLLDLSPPAQILDLACGPGRFALPLAERGFNVIGLDYSSVYVDQGRAYAEDRNLDVRFIQGDMRQIPFDSQFDAVINTCSSFGYFDSDADHLQVLKQVHKALKPGGCCLLEMSNREFIIRNFQPRHWEDRDRFVLLERRELDLYRGRVKAYWRKVYPDGEHQEYTHCLRLFTLSELCQLSQQAGLAVLGAYGGFDGTPYGIDSARLVFLAQKPDNSDREHSLT